MQNCADIRQYFKNKLANEEFTVDRTGSKTIELFGSSFIADEEAIIGTLNHEYIKAEIDWYESGSTNINDIYHGEKEPPAAWKMTANVLGEINSNYGHLIFSDKYGNQYVEALNELLVNPNSRRAMMIYNRPSIWREYNENGKNDFICTNAVAYYIRDGKLNAVVQMRSNDVVFGYKNDRAWAKYVLDMMVSDYNEIKFDEKIQSGTITWNVMNLHVYERHFHLLKD
jgi:thymidylate synthase